MEHVTQFYKNLYDEKETESNFDELFSDSPVLNGMERESLDREITLDELEKVVNECGNSAPGPDGIRVTK